MVTHPFVPMVRAIVAAEPVNVLGGGWVELVVTPRTHFRFRVRRFAEVEGIVSSGSDNCGCVQVDPRNGLVHP